MCGIAGKLIFDQNSKINKHLIEDMISKLEHRGPDDSGSFVDVNFGFGMSRLSIIDLDTGHQPIFNKNGNLSIVFNGEIYNYKELKLELKSIGYKFKTNSDTETILYCYEEFGYDFIQKLNGMFAIAIWDKQKRQLFLARDRLGIKPLYYYLDNEKLLFASEIKAILEDKTIEREINLNGMDLYFSYTYIPAPHSIFRNIFKLEPGHYLICNPEGINKKRYWDLSFSVNGMKKEDDFIEEFNLLFNDSVKLRMISDVPLGAFLSGGIDSSAIVEAMSRNSTQPIKTFSIGFKGDKYHDETRFANLVSQKFETDHKVFHVDYDIINLLPKYISHFDEPFADYAAFPTYLVAKMAREHVKVVLTGDGGDEIFAGYKRHYAERIAKQYKKLPIIIRKNLMNFILMELQKSLSISNKYYSYVKFAQFKNNLIDLDVRDRYINSLFYAKFTESHKSKLYHESNKLTLGNEVEYLRNYWPQYSDDLSNQLYLDIMTSLPDDMLTKVDRMTMAVSLEARVPFLDHRLVEFAATIPSNLKINLRETKRFLRRAVKNVIPNEIINRPKHGFSSPIDKWLREDLQELVFDTLSKNTIESINIFNYKYIQQLLNDHYNRKTNSGNEIFMLMVFVLWHSKYIAS